MLPEKGACVRFRGIVMDLVTAVRENTETKVRQGTNTSALFQTGPQNILHPARCILTPAFYGRRLCNRTTTLYFASSFSSLFPKHCLCADFLETSPHDVGSSAIEIKRSICIHLGAHDDSDDD